jgi:Syndecan domain
MESGFFCYAYNIFILLAGCNSFVNIVVYICFLGIIAGAVLTILFITLLVMFLVYRMRKKDEGSYVLDDPKMSIVGIDHHTRHRQPHQQSSSLVYTKAPTNDREFYA